MKRGTLIVLFLLGTSSALLAQDSEKATLSNLYKKAASYPGLNAKTAGIEAAKIDYKITKREIWPELQLQAQNTYGTYEGAAGAFFPQQGIFNVSGNNTGGNTAVNSLVSATVKWDVIQFGKHRDRVKLSAINRERAENSFDLKDIQLKRELTRAYLSWMYGKYMQDWAEREAERNTDILELSKSLVRSGLGSAADSLIAKTTLKRAVAQQNKWQAKTRRAENQVLEYTGMPLAQKNASERFLSTKDKGLEEPEGKTHPLLVSKDQQRERLSVKEKEVSHQVLPNISVLAGGLLRGEGYSDQGNAWKDSYELPINNYLVGLGLTWNISKFYSKGLKKQKIRQHQIETTEEREVIERSLNEQEQSLEYHIEKVLEEIAETEEAYASAKESYRLFKVRYENGLINLTTLLQIQQTLRFTERSRIKAYYDYWQYWNAYAYALADYSPLTTVFN